MSKGTPSFGKHNKITHLRCRRCGNHSYHKVKSECAKCGYPKSKLKNFRWKWKSVLTKVRKR